MQGEEAPHMAGGWGEIFGSFSVLCAVLGLDNATSASLGAYGALSFRVGLRKLLSTAVESASFQERR